MTKTNGRDTNSFPLITRLYYSVMSTQELWNKNRQVSAAVYAKINEQMSKI